MGLFCGETSSSGCFWLPKLFFCRSLKKGTFESVDHHHLQIPLVVFILVKPQATNHDADEKP